MGTTIGRVGYDLPLSEPTKWQAQGGRVSVEVLIKQQATGLAILDSGIDTPVGLFDQPFFRSFGGTSADGTLNAWTQDSGSFSIASNVVTVPASASAQMHAGNADWTDGRARLRFIFATGARPDLKVHWTATGNWIDVFLGAAFTTITLRKEIAGTPTTVTTSPAFSALVNGTAYWLEIVCTGTTYTAAIYADSGGAIGALIQTAAGTIADASVQAGYIAVASVAAVSYTAGGNFPDVCSWYADGHGFVAKVTTGEPAFSVSTQNPYDGTWSLSVQSANSGADGEWQRQIYADAQSVSLGCEVKQLTAGTGTLDVIYDVQDASFSTADSAWHKVTTALAAVAANAKLRMRYHGGTGTAYFDRIQILGDPKTDMLRLRDQLLGLDPSVGTDEPVVPVTVGTNPRLDGFYRVVAVQAELAPGAFAGVSFPVQLDLEQVQGYGLPLVEEVHNGNLLTNAIGSISSDVQWLHGYPQQVLDYSDDTASASVAVRGSEDGTSAGLGVDVIYGANVTEIKHNARFSIAPADYYKSACKIKVGAPAIIQVGKQTPNALQWELSNGIIRARAAGLDAGTDQLLIDVWQWSLVIGSTWGWVGPKRYRLDIAGSFNFPIPTGLTVLRNSPEECIIRLSGGLGPGQAFQMFVDLRIRRADKWLRGYLSGTSQVWELALVSTAEVGVKAGFGGGPSGFVYAAAYDYVALKYLIGSVQAATVQELTPAGGIKLNAAGKTFDFGITTEISGATNPDDAAHLTNQYMAALGDTARIVPK